MTIDWIILFRVTFRPEIISWPRHACRWTVSFRWIKHHSSEITCPDDSPL